MIINTEIQSIIFIFALVIIHISSTDNAMVLALSVTMKKKVGYVCILNSFAIRSKPFISCITIRNLEGVILLSEGYHESVLFLNS